jgi:hypothetical protein
LIELKVQGQEIKRKDKNKAVANSVKYLKVYFQFSSDWDGTTKTAFFENRANESLNYSQFIIDDFCEVHPTMITVPGFYISVEGVDGDKVITTEACRIPVWDDGIPEGATEPTPEEKSVFAQMIEQMNNAIEGSKNTIYVKYANSIPISDAEMLDTPADYMGVYCGEAKENLSFAEYHWYKIRGEQGEKGDKGDKGDKGEDGIIGKDGADGVSPTHSWNGTVLSITSASGTSSADLKGEQGERGLQGEAFTYEDFTAEQLAELRGNDGTDGVGIKSIVLKETDASGNNIYSVNLTDNTSYEIVAPKGASGSGTGDMQANVYDPQGKVQDIFAYVDNAVANIPTPDVSGQISTHNNDTTAHQDIRNAIPTVPTNVSAFNNDAGYVTSDDIPTKVSELENDEGYLTEHQDITGKYEKPASGIPKTDLASDVQTSLGRADTALQSHQDISGKLDKAGGTMTGVLTAQNNTGYATSQVRNIGLQTSVPTSIANGAIVGVYTI